MSDDSERLEKPTINPIIIPDEHLEGVRAFIVQANPLARNKGPKSDPTNSPLGSELESLQYAPFHVPPSLAHLHPSHLKAMQEEWPAWFPSGEVDPYYDEDATPYTPKPPRIDDALMASLLYAKTSLPWQVQCSRDAHSMYFLCKELSTGIKLRTPTLEPAHWTIEELRDQANIIVYLYEREIARRQGGE